MYICADPRTGDRLQKMEGMVCLKCSLSHVRAIVGIVVGMLVVSLPVLECRDVCFTGLTARECLYAVVSILAFCVVLSRGEYAWRRGDCFFVLCCSWFGAGISSFAALYMPQQALWLQTHADSGFGLLAGNNHFAFNEIYDSHELDNKNANDIVKYWINTPGKWEPIKISEAQKLANEGWFVVAGWLNPTPGQSGHVVVIVPGTEQAGWGGKVPMAMDTGRNMRSESQKLSNSFGLKKKENVVFFKYK